MEDTTDYVSCIREEALSNQNLKDVAQQLRAKMNGTPYDVPSIVKIIKPDFKKHVKKFDDYSSAGEYLETIEYINRSFINSYNVSNINMFKETERTSDWNPFKEVRNGKLPRYETVDDIRNIDAWSDNTLMIDGRMSRRGKGVKGLNNPHLVGAHKRHYERDITNELGRSREIGPMVNYGYNQKKIYDTIINNDLYDWEV